MDLVELKAQHGILAEDDEILLLGFLESCCTRIEISRHREFNSFVGSKDASFYL